MLGPGFGDAAHQCCESGAALLIAQHGAKAVMRHAEPGERGFKLCLQLFD
jgi:hypothetical protein